jgi:integrase
MGSVFSRTDRHGNTIVVCEVTIDGRTRTFYRDEHEEPFPDEKAGRDFLRRLHAEIVALKRRAPPVEVVPEITLGAWLDEWMETVRALRKPTTVALYAARLRKHIPDDLRRLPLSGVTPAVLQPWVNALCRTLSPRTVRVTAGTLQTALREAIRKGPLDRDPFDRVSFPKAPAKQPKVWTPEDARTFLAASVGEPWGIAFATALYLGLRRGELLGLRWSDLDLDAGTVIVRHNLQALPGENGEPYRLVLLSPKSARSRRTLYLPKALVVLLRLHRARQEGEREAAGSAWGRPAKGKGRVRFEPVSDLVFPAALGRPLYPTALCERFRIVRERAGLPAMPPHGLRHTYGTALLVAGEDPRTVMEVLGHSSLSMTTRYLHALESKKKSAAERIARFLGDKGEKEE